MKYNLFPAFILFSDLAISSTFNRDNITHRMCNKMCQGICIETWNICKIIKEYLFMTLNQ